MVTTREIISYKIVMVSKKVFSALLLAFLVFSLVAPVDAAVKVRGYFRKDGTYVQPHYRSNPDGNPYNNWSYPGNTNPYTGKVAPGNPSTYLDNYYNRGNGSTYSPPSYSTPTISSPTISSQPRIPPISSPTYVPPRINIVPDKDAVERVRAVNYILDREAEYQRNHKWYRERLLASMQSLFNLPQDNITSFVYSLLPDIK